VKGCAQRRATRINLLIEQGFIMQSVKEPFTLYLAAWQTRMIQDFMRKKFTKVWVKPGVIQCPASYKIPVDGLSRRDWVLYLTDEQLVIVKEKFGLKTVVTGININEALIKNKSVVFG
jgi:hypothetical protein